VHHTYEHDVWVIPLRRKTQVAEVVDGELQAPKANGLTWGESNVDQVVAIGNDGEFLWINHRNFHMKACCKSPFLMCQQSVFSAPTNNMASKITWFQFWGGLMNN
jgi:hypothetical protein